MPVDLAELSKQLTADGKLIEAGWVGLQLAAVPKDAPEIQLKEMRMAFFAGAAHLFSSLMVIMDEDREPTEADLGMVDKIHAELDAFGKDFEAKHMPTAGRA